MTIEIPTENICEHDPKKRARERASHHHQSNHLESDAVKLTVPDDMSAYAAWTGLLKNS